MSPDNLSTAISFRYQEIGKSRHKIAILEREIKQRLVEIEKLETEGTLI